jgi:hypothetical protein
MRLKRLRTWMRQDGDRGAAVWGICCCWLAVLGNHALLAADVPIAWVIPADIVVVPAVVTAALLAASRG